ncbi:hypothetical protein FLJ40288, isoform CRA_b [Homo sapiens]|uniref:Putative uncharacterized protein FLJ40288 n=1 Tax=Homo sapiens TaxID=9606 RepID=YG018_HUMAN|nr:RecName: Full=Putative uncharacterized protein FLJ40288 [Homo sapiens]EAL24075.1 hypothetical protein FLJ40288 [Homo sapiens]EAW83798.1 hypothetical protein FLJ40288, isoform CRA_b [Homo sapiens]
MSSRRSSLSPWKCPWFVYCFERPISREAGPVVHQSPTVLYLHSELAARQTQGRLLPREPAAEDLRLSLPGGHAALGLFKLQGKDSYPHPPTVLLGEDLSSSGWNSWVFGILNISRDEEAIGILTTILQLRETESSAVKWTHTKHSRELGP